MSIIWNKKSQIKSTYSLYLNISYIRAYFPPTNYGYEMSLIRQNDHRWRHDPQATHLKEEKTNDELNFVLRPLDITIAEAKSFNKSSEVSSG